MLRPSPDTLGSTRRLLLQLAVALLGLAAAAEVLVADGPLRDVYVAYLFPALGALYVSAGTLAWWLRPANRLGSLMTACGTVIIASNLANSGIPRFVALGAITATLPLSVVLHLVHACPTGVVRGRASRLTVGGAYFAGLVLQVPIWAFTPQPPPFDEILVAPRPRLAEVAVDVQQWFGAALVAVTIWLLAQRLREYGTADRRLLAALLGFAILAVLTVAVGADVLDPLGLGAQGVADMQIAAVAIVPLGFLFVVVRGGFARSGELVAFTRAVAAPAGSIEAGRELDRAVGAALGDPASVLLRWRDGGFVDAEGRPAALDTIGPHQSLVRIDGAGAPLGALVHDTALGTDPATLAAVTNVAGIALERERLAGEVAASRTALQDASRRVLVAGDAERRRITRDLHDGLQGALVLLSMHARELARDPAHTDTGRATALADGLDAAARTLRGLVDGVLPSPLVERGLAVAVRDLADDLPMDVTVSVRPPDIELSTPVETTAYFVVAEAMTNVVKHSRAERAEINVHFDGDVLTLEVVDDGVGGDAYAGGSGLTGLRDRLEILGGTMEVTSPGVGTRVVARLPCG